SARTARRDAWGLLEVLAFGFWLLAFGSWPLANALCPLTANSQPLTANSQPLTANSQPIMAFSKHIAFFLLLSLLSSTSLVLGQEINQQALPEKTRILFVLDGSGSMNAEWGGGQSRMDIAKSILSNLVDSLRVN